MGIGFARCEVRGRCAVVFRPLAHDPKGTAATFEVGFGRSNEDAPINRSSALRIHPGAPCSEGMSAADLRAGLAKVKQEKADAAERTFVSRAHALTMLGPVHS